MSTTSRADHFGNTLRSWALLPPGGADGGTAQRLPARPVPRASLLRLRVVDLALTVVALLLAVSDSVMNPNLGPAAPWANLVFAVVSALPLLVRRRAPELVLAAGLLAKIFQVSPFALPLAYYAEGAYRGPHSRRTAWVSAGIGLVAVAPWPWSAETWTDSRAVVSWFTVNFVLSCLVPLLLGLYVGQRRAVVAGLVERAERAEREQRLVAEAAREQERRRIAGEMHDVVSHQVSLIVVHANALGAVAHDPEMTGETAQIIRTAGRRALTELREMLGLLRNGAADRRAVDGPVADRPATDSPAAGGPVAGDEEPSASGPGPGPGSAGGPGRAVVERVTELADGSRAAGLPVTVHVEGAPQPLAEPVERAAYRIAQEALTNVHKHAPGATTRIHLAFAPGTVRVRIVNGPPGKPAEPAADGEPMLPSGGHGLIGLAERVRLAGGTFESGAAGDGGFRVEAALPTSVAGAPVP